MLTLLEFISTFRYLANNSLESLRELQKLKQLSNLIILDLVGNIASVNTDPAEYRPYCIFHLPQLKVLDGSGITSAEYVVHAFRKNRLML